MSSHELVLKLNCPVILLWNLDPSSDLCNGTRLICRICRILFNAKFQHDFRRVSLSCYRTLLLEHLNHPDTHSNFNECSSQLSCVLLWLSINHRDKLFKKLEYIFGKYAFRMVSYMLLFQEPKKQARFGCLMKSRRKIVARHQALLMLLYFLYNIIQHIYIHNVLFLLKESSLLHKASRHKWDTLIQ